MPNKYGEFTSDDGWSILNQVRGFHTDQIRQDNLALDRQRLNNSIANDNERLRLYQEKHAQDMAFGKQTMEFNAASNTRAEEEHTLNQKLTQANINIRNLSFAEKKKTAAYADAARVKADELHALAKKDGLQALYNFKPANTVEAAALKMVGDQLKGNEEVSGQLAKLHDERVTYNYAKNVGPNIDRALNALKADDLNGFANHTRTAMHYADLPYRLEPSGDGFKMLMRSDENDGKFVETGAVLSKDEAVQYLTQVKNGEQTGEGGIKFNPAYNNMAAQAREATAQINSANLLDTSKWKPVHKDGKTLFAVPQSPLGDYTADTRYILVDKDGSTVAGFDFDNPLTAGQLAEAGVTATKGLSRKPMAEKDRYEAIRKACTTKDAMGNEVFDTTKASVMSQSGGDIYAAGQRYDSLVSELAAGHAKTGAGKEHALQLAQQQAHDMLLNSAKPQKGGLAQHPASSPKAAPSSDKKQFLQQATEAKGGETAMHPALPPKGLIVPPNEGLTRFNDPSVEMASSHEQQGPYGLRNDGTQQGSGYFGELQMQDGSGNVATELSIGVEMDGREVEIPTIVPTLTKEELNHLLQGGEPTPQIIDKAVQHARERMAQGLNPFASNQNISQR